MPAAEKLAKYPYLSSKRLTRIIQYTLGDYILFQNPLHIFYYLVVSK